MRAVRGSLSPCIVLLVQVITTRGKESVLSEKRMRAGYGATLVTGFSKVIESKDLPDFEGFAAEVSMLGR